MDGASLMKISVVIATYNRCESLIKTLQSIAEQIGIDQADYEIIVVDNNSTDRTREAVESLAKSLNSRITYLFEPRQGKIYALNRGIEAARGDLIAMTDDDCLVGKKWLFAIKETFDCRNIDILGGKVIPQLDVVSDVSWLDPHRLTGPIAHYNKGDVYFENNDGRIILPIGANMIVRKSAISLYGTFTKNIRAEDTDFVYRWGALGAKIAYSPDVVVVHCIEAIRLKKEYFRKWYFLCGRNSVYVFNKKFNSGNIFWGVSKWVYRELFRHALGVFKNIFLSPKEAFYNEAFVCYYCGILWGCFGKKTNFENLR